MAPPVRGAERQTQQTGLRGWVVPSSPRCALFLVLKAELELARNDLDLCQSDLQQVLFLLESCTGEQLCHGRWSVCGAWEIRD